MSDRSYDDVARRWRDRALGRDTRDQFYNRRMPVRGDSIYSYGTHFEIARLIRDKKGQPSHWLLNGDRWGPTTGKHQAIVRGALTGYLESVIIPHAALTACGIDFDSVQIIDVKPDWGESGTIVSKEFPKGAKWEYEHTRVEGTGDFFESPWMEFARSYARNHEGKAYVPYLNRNTGRKRLWQRSREWTLVDDGEGGIEYHHEWHRHRLGGSLIRAKVDYIARIKCVACNGTGKAEERTDRFGNVYDHCPDCAVFSGGRIVGRPGMRSVRRQRWAYFLSAFDDGETRPSYFLCELDPKARPTTFEEAIESLKPQAVKLAESMGREVKRQGDIFAIPMPSLTLAQLKKMGGKHERFGNLLGTNHQATDVVRVGKHTYIRGTMRHVPEFRRPDHVRVTVGKTWHLVQKNTVPIAAGRRR